jgi:hypothetical protein
MKLRKIYRKINPLPFNPGFKPLEREKERKKERKPRYDPGQNHGLINHWCYPGSNKL